MIADIDAFCARDQRTATSVFVGGGTPSLLPGHSLGAVLDRIRKTSDAEVTVECNPDNVTAELFDAYRSHGVNRVSFGVQSMVDSVLVSLGREHDRANVVRAVQEARAAGFASFNLDLIYGGVAESFDDWNETLSAVIDLDPPHISAYALTVEAGTPLSADRSRHPDDDDQAEKYEHAAKVLAEAGYENYEISNWAKPGHRCRHNVLYWTHGDYIGVGCAAHSHQLHDDGTSRRWWNLRTPERYVAAVEAGESTEGTGEDLDIGTVALERLQLQLRMADGVARSALTATDLDEFLEHGLLVELDNDRVALSVRGRLMANTVSIRLRAAEL